jgi:hypothetical protein
MKKILILVFLLVGATTAHSESSMGGLSGLGEMRTPDVIGAGRSEIYLAPRYSLLGEGMGSQTQVRLGYLYGLGDSFELGTQLGLRVVEGGSGLTNIPLLAKVQLVNSGRFLLAGTGFVYLPVASVDAGLGSGSFNFGAELNAGYTLSSLGLYLSFTYERQDYCPGCEMPGLQTAEPSVQPVATLRGGAEWNFDSASVFGELHGINIANGRPSGAFNGDQSILLVAGSRWQLGEAYSLTTHAGIGLPNWDQANHALVFGLIGHYKLGGRGAARVADAEEPAPIAAEVEKRTAPAPAAAVPAPAAPAPAAAAAPARKPTVAAPKKPAAEIRVAVINSCKTGGAVDDAAKRILIAGYNLTAISEDLKTPAGVTAIQFRPGLREEAVELAGKISGRKRLLQNAAIAADTDIVVHVNCE